MPPRVVSFDKRHPQRLTVQGTTDGFRRSVPGFGYDGNVIASPSPYTPPSPKLMLTLMRDFDCGATQAAMAWLLQEQRLRDKVFVSQTRTETDATIPPGLKLRPFQCGGVEMLSLQHFALLCDEQGLGKTVQSLVALRKDFQETVSDEKATFYLVICLKNSIATWEYEINRWWADLPHKTIPLHYSTKRKDILNQAIHTASFGKATFVITNWASLLSLGSIFASVPWRGIIGDEAHKIKNRNAKTTKELRTLIKTSAPQNIFFLTGTPVEKSPADMWSLLNLIKPRKFTSFWSFVSVFATHTSGWNNWQKVSGHNPETIHILHDLLAPHYLRRLRKDTLKDVREPQKISIPVILSKKHRHVYKQLMLGLKSELFSDTGTDLGLGQKVTKLLRARQVTVEPNMLDIPEEVSSSKIEAAVELIQETLSDDKVIVYTTFRAAAKAMHEALAPKTSRLYLSGMPETLFRDWAEATENVLCTTFGSLGTAVNLQHANVEVFLDLPWSSLQIQQAIGRIVRIGQEGQTAIYILFARNTVDEYVNKLVSEKLKSFDATVVTSAVLQAMHEGNL